MYFLFLFLLKFWFEINNEIFAVTEISIHTSVCNKLVF